MSFKAGDIVRVLYPGGIIRDWHQPGSILTVGADEVNEHIPFFKDVDNEYFSFRSNWYELISRSNGIRYEDEIF